MHELVDVDLACLMQNCTTVEGCLGVGGLTLPKALNTVGRAGSYPSNEKDGVLGCVSKKLLTRVRVRVNPLP